MTDNVLSAFAGHAHARPEQDALLITSPSDGSVTERVTYGDLLIRSEWFAAGLKHARLRARQCVVSASPLSIDFYALAVAVVGSGLTLGLIDGRLDRRRMLSALRSARPKAIVSTAEILTGWPAVPPLWRARRYVAEGGEPGFGLTALSDLTGHGRLALSPGRPEDPAIISFTSGSTGRAKGVVLTNGILLAQHLALSANVPLHPGDIDMTCFPAVLHNLGSGVTTVLPPVDLRAPAGVDPALALTVMRDHGVTTLSGAPAFIGRIVKEAGRSGDPPPLRQIVLGGAPVSRALCKELTSAFPDTVAVIVYGSTEAEPIAHVSAREVLAAADSSTWRAPAGLLVGSEVAGVRAEIVKLPVRVKERVTEEWIEARRADVGEVVVYGANVSRLYSGDRDATARDKIRLVDGAVWHRTGDVARRDEQGRLRLLGRVGDGVPHRGGTIYPIPLEAQLAAVPGVRRVALVSVGGKAVLAAEVEGDPAFRALGGRVRELGLAGIEIRRVTAVPVDARHQSKIDRSGLIAQLAGQSQ